MWPLTNLTNELSHQPCPPLADSVQQGCPPLVCGSVHLSSIVQQQLQLDVNYSDDDEAVNRVDDQTFG